MFKIIVWIILMELLHTSILSVHGRNIKQGVFLQEVPLGDNAEIKCESNDNNYIFDYWILDNNDIIGPTNENFDALKFGYEVLSGNLTIRAFSKQDEGLYICVSRAAKGNDIRVGKVKIIILQDWEDVYEHDSNVNLVRIVIIIITLTLLGIGCFVVFKMWRERFRHPRYLEHEDEEENVKELFPKPASTSGINRSRSPGRIVLDGDNPNYFNDYSNNGTDFKSILEKSND